jgi:CHAT domain-containing protein/tetratricopeptide (TPR) repeat protein
MPAGQSGRFVAEQPVDLHIHVSGPFDFLVDGFDFGPETATLAASGIWRIDIEAVSPAPAIEVTLQIVSPETSAGWRKAEDLATLSRHTRTLENIAKSLAAWIQLGDASAIARTYIKQGRAYSNSGDFRAAEGAYERALKTSESISDARCSAEAANDAGLMALRLGNYDAALDRLNRALELWKIVSLPEFEAVTLSNLGLLYRQSGDYQNAIARYDQAYLLLRAQRTVARALVVNNLGVCYQSLADYNQARLHFERALADFSELKSTQNVVLARLNLGRTLLLEGENLRAQRALEQSLADATSGNYRTLHADALNNLGQIRLAENAPAVARQRLQDALELHRALGDRRMEASDLHYLGIAAQRLGDLDTARTFLTDALEIRRAMGIRDSGADSLIALADLAHGEQQSTEQRQFAEQALVTLESMRDRIPTPELRATYYAREHHLFDLLLDLAISPGNPNADEDGLIVVEQSRGRALLDVLSAPALGQVPPDLARRRADVQRRLDFAAAHLSTAPPARASEIRTEMSFLAAADQEIAADIRQMSPLEELSRPLVSVSELQNGLPADTAVLEYYLGETRSWLWIVSKHGLQRFPIAGRSVIEAQSAAVLRLFVDITGRRSDPEKQKRFESALRRLSATLMGPLADQPLPARLVLVPDGILTRVPFAALADNSRHPLGLAHDVVQVSSSAYLTAGKKPRVPSEFPRAFLAIADPVFAGNDPRVTAKLSAVSPGAFARLPFTDEVDMVSALIPSSRRLLLRGFDATPDRLRRLHLSDFAVLHFSTHALIDDRIPELSRIALSMVGRTGQPVDGFLRPPEFAGFHLQGSVVVLSACQTALGKQVLGEGLLGFTSSLFQAGAAQLVLSLSEVDAEGSSAFFVETYRNFFAARPVSMEHSMTLARRSLAASKRWADPYYWASFVVYGRPSDAGGRQPL